MTDRKQKKDAEQAKQDFLDKWKKQFETDRQSKSEMDQIIDLCEEYYQGKRYFGNLTEMGLSTDRDVRTVVNFVRMMVEAVIDLSVPEPDLQAQTLDDEKVIKLFNKYISYVCHNTNDLEKINLENERRVKKFGSCFYKAHWNNAIKNGKYVGDIEISNPHPKHIVPNAGATNWNEDLEHYHHVVNKTTKYIMRRWPNVTKDEIEDKATLYKEYDEMKDGSGTVTVNGGLTYGGESTSSNENGLNRYSVIETTYRDEDGDVGKMWWSGDLLFEDMPKFYWHRDGEGNPVDTYYLEPGTQIRIGTDSETGEPLFRTVEQQMEIDEITGEEIPVFDDDGLPLGEEVEYYIPKRWDIVCQPFIPKDLSCWSTSMIEDIADLYESLLKAVHIQEEGFLRGRKKIVTDNEADEQKIMDSASEVVTLMGTVKEIDLNTNIDGILWIEKLKEWMQLITGATNAQMGVHDAGVKSAKQAQVYVSQANFKASLASTYKAIAFKELYRVIADFALAFCDDDRPFRLSGENKNDTQYGTFSRMAMLRDDSGNIVYPNWDIGVSSQAGWMQNKSEIMNNIVMLANNKNFEPTRGNLTYLKVLQKLGMPYLDGVLQDLEVSVEKAEKLAEEQQEMQKKQQELQLKQQQGSLDEKGTQSAQGGGLDTSKVISQLTPEQQAQFKSLPAEQQQQLLQQVAQGQGGV